MDVSLVVAGTPVLVVAQQHGFLHDAVALSDDTGQFDVGAHALCWVHAERLVHKLDTFTDQHRTSQEYVRALTVSPRSPASSTRRSGSTRRGLSEPWRTAAAW